MYYHMRATTIPCRCTYKHMQKNFVVLDLKKEHYLEEDIKKRGKRNLTGKFNSTRKKRFFWKFKISFRKKEFLFNYFLGKQIGTFMMELSRSINQKKRGIFACRKHNKERTV